MKWPKQNEIPQTVIKPGDAIITDFSPLNGEGSLMFYNLRCAVIGLDGLPYILFITPEFNEEEIPLNIRKNIYEAERLIFQSTFMLPSKKDPNPKYIYPIPLLVKNFKKVKHINFHDAHLDNLDYLKNLPIEELIMQDVYCDNIPKAIEAISSMKSLKELSYNQAISVDLINGLKKLNLKLKTLD